MVIEATQLALDAGQTKYSPAAGLPELKSLLARQFDGYDQRNIIISNGSKQCLYAMFQAICNPMDEVIIPRPYWVSFPQQVKLAGGCPVFVDTAYHQLDCEKIERAITPKNPCHSNQLTQQPHRCGLFGGGACRISQYSPCP